MESLSKDDRFRVAITEYDAGVQRPEYSAEYHSFLAAYKYFLDTNAQLGVGKTPECYMRAECVQWYNSRLNKWDEIMLRDYHEFASTYLLDCMQKGNYLGYIEYRKERDRWQNDISLVYMPDGKCYRMVHHSKELAIHYKQYARLYRKSGVYINYEYTHPSSDTAMKTVSLAGYSMSWGDGEPGWYVVPDGCPDLRGEFAKIFDEDTAAFVLVVMKVLHEREDLWQVKVREDKSR